MNIENNINPSSQAGKTKSERKYKEYLSSALGAEISKKELLRSMNSNETTPDFNMDDFKYGPMAVHDFKIELSPSGDIIKDVGSLFQAVNATKLIERLDNNEDPIVLLNELKSGMQNIIDNSNKTEFKDSLWKAIEVKIVIEDILSAIPR